jgi:hypothetical protein
MVARASDVVAVWQARDLAVLTIAFALSSHAPGDRVGDVTMARSGPAAVAADDRSRPSTPRRLAGSDAIASPGNRSPRRSVAAGAGRDPLQMRFPTETRADRALEFRSGANATSLSHRLADALVDLDQVDSLTSTDGSAGGRAPLGALVSPTRRPQQRCSAGAVQGSSGGLCR